MSKDLGPSPYDTRAQELKTSIAKLRTRLDREQAELDALNVSIEKWRIGKLEELEDEYDDEREGSDDSVHSGGLSVEPVNQIKSELAPTSRDNIQLATERSAQPASIDEKKEGVRLEPHSNSAEPNSSPSQSTEQSSVHPRHLICIAITRFPVDSSTDELWFNKDNVLAVTHECNGWYQSINLTTKQSCLAPANYVEILMDIPLDSLSSSGNQSRSLGSQSTNQSVKQPNDHPVRVVRCMYNFDSQTPGDLSLKVGDVCLTYEEHGEWYTGRTISNAQLGNFPKTYCEFIEDLSSLFVAPPIDHNQPLQSINQPHHFFSADHSFVQSDPQLALSESNSDDDEKHPITDQSSNQSIDQSDNILSSRFNQSMDLFDDDDVDFVSNHHSRSSSGRFSSFDERLNQSINQSIKQSNSHPLNGVINDNSRSSSPESEEIPNRLSTDEAEVKIENEHVEETDSIVNQSVSRSINQNNEQPSQLYYPSQLALNLSELSRSSSGSSSDSGSMSSGLLQTDIEPGDESDQIASLAVNQSISQSVNQNDNDERTMFQPYVVEAIYPFSGGEGQLSFAQFDRMNVVDRVGEWLFGHLVDADDRTGLFPEVYSRKIDS